MDSSNSSSSNNRLAPYNPTHISAQGRALDLLQLTTNDVFFDLGCGDGRLILAAIDRYYSSAAAAATTTDNSNNDEYAVNANNGDEEDEDGSGDSNIDRPSIINRRQSTRSSGEKTTIVRNNTSTTVDGRARGVVTNGNEYLNNSLTTKVSNLTLSNSLGYNNWNNGTSQHKPSSSSSVLSSSFFIDATTAVNKSTNAATNVNDNNNNSGKDNINSDGGGVGGGTTDDCGSLYNVYSREGSKSFDNDESEYSFPHMMRMRSVDDDDDDNNGNDDAEYSFPHLMRMKSGSQDDFDDDNYNPSSNENDEITASDIFDNGSDAKTQLSSSSFGPHLGGVMASLSPRSGVSQLQPPPTLSPNTPITPQTDNCKQKKKDHDVLYRQKINIFDDAVFSPMMLCPSIPYDDEDDDADDVDDDDDDNDHKNDSDDGNSNDNNDDDDDNNHKMFNYKIGIPKTIKTTLPKDDNNENDDDYDDDNVYTNEQQSNRKKQQHYHHHRNYFTSSLTTYSAYPIQEQTLFRNPTESNCNHYNNDNNYNNEEETEERNFALMTQTLETIPSGDELITNANTNNNYNDEYENDDVRLQSPKSLLLPCEKHEITSNKSDEQQQRRQHNSSSSSTIILRTRLTWLRCVGIEINQPLAKSAQENVRQKIMLYMTLFPQQEQHQQQQQSLMNSVCIHWGDVMEEINRSRHSYNNNSPHSGRNGDNVVEDSGIANALHVSWLDGYGDDIRERTAVNDEVSHTSPSTTTFTTINDEENNWDCNVSDLTVLDDATATFVYLLPKGLEKIKPILHAAAVIRHRQRELQIARQSQQQQQQKSTQLFRQQQHKQLHPLHRSPQLRTLDEKEDISAIFLSDVPSYEDGEMEFCPLPQQRNRKRGDSHVSDITDDTFCNFTRTSLEGIGPEVLKILHEDGSNGVMMEEPKLVSSTLSEQRSSIKTKMQIMKKTMIEESEMIIPSFRVVSYMFQIPGWTPVTVDTSSKGQCPLYLYEDIHEEDT